MRPRNALIALLVAAALLATAGAASPRPVPVCQPCGFGFEQATTSPNNVPESVAESEVSVAASTATVRVHENGTADWTIRNELSDQDVVDHFRENPDDLRAVATEAWTLGDADLVSAAVADDGTVILRYRVPEFATRTSGVLRVDYFREEPGRYTFYELGADRLTLVGPPDTRVTSAIPGATVDGNEMTATTYEGRGDGPFVVFASADDPFAGARTHAAVAAATGGTVVRNLLVLVALPAAIVAAGALGAGATARRGVLAAGRTRARRLGGAVAAAGAAVALYAALPGYQPIVGGYTALWVVAGVTAAVLGGVVAARPTGWTRRRLGALAAGATVTGAVVATTAAAVHPEAAVDGSVAWAVPAAAVPLGMLAVGATRDAGRREHRLAMAAPPVGYAVAAAAATPLTAAGGTFFVVTVLVHVGVAVVATVAGLPLAALGAAVPLAEGASEPPRPPRADHASE